MSFRPSLLILALALGSACGTKPPVSGPLGPETCNNKADDNGDGKVDCLDPTCFQDAACRGLVERCDNEIDDNGDSLTDCQDPLCAGQSCGFDCTCIGGFKITGASGGGSGGGTTGGGSGGGATGGGSGGGATGGGSGGGATGGGSGGGATGGGSGGGATGGGSGGGATGGGSGGGATGGGSGGGATGGGSGGGATGGGSGGGATGGGSAGPETNCADNLDNDGDNGTDCSDSDCVGVTCGMGCTCALARKTEIDCHDGADNDGDTLVDCADSDCFGAGTELCGDGIDNDCDRGIDCGDSSCTASALCTGLNDGKPCLSNGQCAGNKCFTEATNGAPNGSCGNAVSCTVGTNVGCNGGICVAGSTVNTCYAKCTGAGTTGTNPCRPGYICFDPDTNTTNGNNYCYAGCASTTECAGAGTGYGCNPWSKRCGNVNRGLGRYGASCTGGSQCESGICFTGPDYPGGYCVGVCRGDTSNCALGGFCSYSASWGDNLGLCYQSCTMDSQCLNPDLICIETSPGASTAACSCFTSGSDCSSDGDCCSGYCSGLFFPTCD